MTARFTIGSVSLLVLGTLIAAFWTTKDDSPGLPPSSKAAPSLRPDFSLDVAQWHTEFARDPQAAAARYKDKVVELTGEVEWVSEDPTQQLGCVFLKVEGAPLQDRCATVDKQPWLKVSPGSRVRIRGRVPEYGLPRDLGEAEIVEMGPNRALVTSAEQLATDYVAALKAGTADYDDKWVILEGVVLGKSKGKDCAVQLQLEAAEDVTVCCCFSDRNKAPLEGVNAGSKVKVFGQLSTWKDKEIVVNSSILAAPR